MASHRVEEDWIGERVTTLEDLLRPGLRAVCVGINPSPRSVELGHYYQGRLGRKFFARLRTAGVLSEATVGCEDDAAFASGIGFTDIVKRPTARAKELWKRDFDHGRPQLLAKRIKRPLWLSVPVISPVPSSTTFSIHIFSSSGSSGHRPNIVAIGLGNGFGKNR